MKTIKNVMIAMLAVFAVSCTQDDVENRPVVEGKTAPVLTAPEAGNVYVLNPDAQDVLAERFVWSAADFGEGIIPNYEVEIDYQGDNFDTPQTIGTTSGTLQFAASNGVLNTSLLALGATPFTAATFEVRVKAYVGESIMYSEPVEMSITPFTTEAPKMYVVGNFQAASGYGSDWTPADAVMIQAPEYGDTNFEGYVYMNVAAPEFKFLPTNTSFDGDYGDDGSFGGILAQDGEQNVQLSAPGYYLIKADTDAMTYSATATTWGLIGSATAPVTGGDGWGTDADMTYDPGTKKWSITINLVGGAEVKFRANNGWTINMGDNAADGSLEQDGSNIAVPTSGSYTVTLDLSVPRHYTYSLTAN